jgi:CO dehydrogenase maturation factor
MKIAVSGKGGVGKTTIVAWLGDYLARWGKTVWMIDADTALSLGQASGLTRSEMPEALIQRKELIQGRIRPDGGSMMVLNPRVNDLPESLFVSLPLGGPPFAGIAPGEKKLLVMGSLSSAGGGCACDSNALLKALLAHLVLEREEWVLVDMEAGIEHLGRGTIAHVDQLLVLSEPGVRSLETAAEISHMAGELGLIRQTLILNQGDQQQVNNLPALNDLPSRRIVMPTMDALKKRRLQSASVLGLDEHSVEIIDAFFTTLLQILAPAEELPARRLMNAEFSGRLLGSGSPLA